MQNKKIKIFGIIVVIAIIIIAITITFIKKDMIVQMVKNKELNDKKANIETDILNLIEDTKQKIQEDEEREATLLDLKNALQEKGYNLDETTGEMNYDNFKVIINENLTIQSIQQLGILMDYKITSADKEYINMLLTFEDIEYGITQIEDQEGFIVYCNNRTKVAMDYRVKPETKYEFTITNGNNEQEKKYINEQHYTGALLHVIGKNEVKGNTSLHLAIDNSTCYDQIDYSVNSIIHNGDMILDGTQQYEGATLNNNGYSFGNASDIGTRTVVLKVNGDLTINEGVALTAVRSSYGGPKGLIIYCTGTLTNNGTITMSQRGARAAGENIYLWGNQNGTYEYIPAYGGAGAENVSIAVWINARRTTNGKAGRNGTNRQTGGGGSGAASNQNSAAAPAISGTGSAGTSYSGGTGGGAARGYQNRIVAGNAAGNGGNGGYGAANGSGAGGGAGNPGGSGTVAGTSGTGGLLVIYSKTFNNNATISSNGSTGGASSIGGGSSGGGSVNIFSEEIINRGTLTAVGGGSVSSGGAGGNGTTSIGIISDGTYQPF